ncbi:MAG TPA: hypothetical protein H9813_02695 [Candidatus Fournierella merdipullorum]|uniref:Uncharacterized protein n=1 Tax=Candidatus Allofournierella merdipullorum TaxID=2838595 RepID=A0A9D2IYN0_9FIRM|nr:hypothetical protein [Candidatus Fournierella merdipullorum]
MKRVYITAVPLDSNFAIQRQTALPANYTAHHPPRAAYYPIVPVIEDTARPGDEVRVIAVRQTNAPHSENLEIFRRELEELGLPFTLTDLTVPETQQKNALLDLFEALTGCMEPDACYYACVTFGTKTWPLVLSSALRYAEKLLDGTEVKGVYYREITRKAGEQTGVAQYDVSALFTLDSIIDLAAGAGVENRQAFLRLLLHPDREA